MPLLHRGRSPARRRPAHPAARSRPPARRSTGRSPAGSDSCSWPRPHATSPPRREPSSRRSSPSRARSSPRASSRSPCSGQGWACSKRSPSSTPTPWSATWGWSATRITHEPRDYYAKLPPMEGRRALVVDPMLATGGSGSAAVAYVKEAGATDIVFVCVVAAPEGLAKHAGRSPRRADRGRGGARPPAQRATPTSFPGSATSATASTARSSGDRARAPARPTRCPPSYARPAAAGGRTLPTNPAIATIVTT